MHPPFKKQKEAFAYRLKKAHEVVYGIQNAGGTYEYNTCETQEDFANYLLDNRYCNECLWTHTKSYLDLDAYTSLEDLGFTQKAFMQKFNVFLQDSYSKYLGIKVLKKHIFWSSSCRAEKVSFHIVINHPTHYWHVEDRKHMKTFMKQLVRDSLKIEGFYVFEKAETEFKKISILDLAVYIKNRLFRSVGQCKRGVDVELQPLNKPLTALNILNHLITVSEVEGMTRIDFKKDKKCNLLSRKEKAVSTRLLDKLANECGTVVSDVKGSLICLRNKHKTRKCILTAETHCRQNSYFLKRGNEILFGCHGCADTPLKVVHTYETTKEFEYYESYKKILEIYKKQPENFSRKLIEKYLLQTVTFIDKASDPHFIVNSRVPVLNGKLHGKQVLSTKNLFFRHSDIHLEQGEDILKFSAILSHLTKKRRIKTYNNTCWVPFAKESKYQPEISPDSLNLFSGYNLENYTSTRKVDFKKTNIYQLLYRNLTNRDPVCFKYLCCFVAHRLQKSWVKIPTCNIWASSCPGTGKSTFSLFLKTLFSAGKEQIFCSYSNMESFQSAFNFEKRHALFVALEECPQGKRNKDFDNYLKDFVSNPNMLLEIKGQDRVTVPSYSSVLVYSNRMKVINVDQRDRRMVFYICNTEQANQKQFFDELYMELNDLDVLKSAFNYFLELDIDNWDWRKFPVTALRKKVQQCSIQLDFRWLRYFFTRDNFYCSGPSFEFSKIDLYECWQIYIESHGINSRRDYDYVVSSFELAMDVECNEHDRYIIPRSYATEKLTEFFGQKVHKE